MNTELLREKVKEAGFEVIDLMTLLHIGSETLLKRLLRGKIEMSDLDKARITRMLELTEEDQQNIFGEVIVRG